jgi:hypothetical protein
MDAMLVLLGIAGVGGAVILCFKVSDIARQEYGLALIPSWSFSLVLLSFTSLIISGVVEAEDQIMAAEFAAFASVAVAALVNVWKSTLWFGVLVTIVQAALVTTIVLVFFIWSDSRSQVPAGPKRLGTW